MNTWFELALACLVCARLTRMIILDTGPWSVFKKFREWLGVERPKEFTYGGLVELFNCPWCLSVPMSFPVVSVFGPSSLEEWIVHALAVSFVAGALVVSTHKE